MLQAEGSLDCCSARGNYLEASETDMQLLSACESRSRSLACSNTIPPTSTLVYLFGLGCLGPLHPPQSFELDAPHPHAVMTWRGRTWHAADDLRFRDAVGGA